MKRTTIMAKPETIETLRAIAIARHTSLAEVAREALEAKAREYRPTPQSLGVAESAPAATAETEGSERTPPRSWR